MIAKEIKDCSDCPLYGYDCSGGATSNGNGTPIEPPCCSWDKEEDIYEGMYEDNQYEPSETELEWQREHLLHKEEERREKEELQHKEEVKALVNKISKYGNAKVKIGGEINYDWYCPRCNRWFHAWYESCHNGVTETSCNYCGISLAHSCILD